MGVRYTLIRFLNSLCSLSIDKSSESAMGRPLQRPDDTLYFTASGRLEGRSVKWRPGTPWRSPTLLRLKRRNSLDRKAAYRRPSMSAHEDRAVEDEPAEPPPSPPRRTQSKQLRRKPVPRRSTPKEPKPPRGRLQGLRNSMHLNKSLPDLPQMETPPPTPAVVKTPALSPLPKNKDSSNMVNDCGTAVPLSPRPRVPSAEFQTTSTTASMDRETVCEMSTQIDRCFGHIPYAICGLSALVHHGFTQRKPTKIHVVCPSHARHVVRSWALAQAVPQVHDRTGNPNVFALRSRSGDWYAVKVRYAADFGEMGIHTHDMVSHLGPGSSSSPSLSSSSSSSFCKAPARVLDLPTLADEVAVAYVDQLRTATAGLEKQKGFEEDMRWILARIAERHAPADQDFAKFVPHIVHNSFWLPFTASFPYAIQLFQRAGLEVDKDDNPIHPHTEEDPSITIDTSEEILRRSPDSSLGIFLPDLDALYSATKFQPAMIPYIQTTPFPPTLPGRTIRRVEAMGDDYSPRAAYVNSSGKGPEDTPIRFRV